MNKTSLLELAKKVNVPHRNCMKTREELEEAIKDTITRYKEIIFRSDTPVCMACLDELRKQQVIGQKVYYQKVMENFIKKLAWEEFQRNIVMDGDMMINKRKGEVLDLEVNSSYWKDNFKLTIKLHAVGWRRFIF